MKKYKNNPIHIWLDNIDLLSLLEQSPMGNTKFSTFSWAE